jgi:hypothetical protein
MSALDGGEWSAPRHGHFNPEERTPVHTGQEAGWVQSWPGRGGEEKNSQSSPRLEPPNFVQPVASRYTDWATTALVLYMGVLVYICVCVCAYVYR